MDRGLSSSTASSAAARPRSAPDQLVRDLVVAVFRANGAIIATGDRLVADLGLTSALWQVLDALERLARPASVAEVARFMGLARQSVQRSADLLVEGGWIAIEADPHHRRAKLARLTPTGREILSAIHRREAASNASVLTDLGPGKVADALALVTRFTRLLASHAGNGDIE